MPSVRDPEATVATEKAKELFNDFLHEVYNVLDSEINNLIEYKEGLEKTCSELSEQIIKMNDSIEELKKDQRRLMTECEFLETVRAFIDVMSYEDIEGTKELIRNLDSISTEKLNKAILYIKEVYQRWL